MRSRPLLVLLASVGLSLLPGRARAGNTLALGTPNIDPPTPTTIGLQLPISGDDDFDATVAVRYRKNGSSAWSNGPQMFRVHPEVVAGRTVPAQFAVSIFDLAPGTLYDVELHAIDPDGLDQTLKLSTMTRAMPRKEPATTRAVKVTDAASLKSALATAKAGDVITLAKGTYSGQFSINASGDEDNPIFIRGEDEEGVVLDGGGCTGCNVFEVYGSWITLERLSIAHAERAVRFQTAGAQGNVVRRVHISDVTLGIGGKSGQKNFYLCDNVVEGRLKWPLTYGDDGAAHASDDGLVVVGSGMVVCHNTISGFADALQNAEDGARANDFYGNDILWTYDDGIELDGMEGNGRCFRNRFTNTFDTTSFQPIFGGPAYVLRNVIVNVRGEGMKLHALGGTPVEEPSGVLVYHNTFVKQGHAIQLSTANVVHWYALENNLFIGAPTDGRVVEWDTPIDYATALIDRNGYWPDGQFHFGYGATGKDYASFAELSAGGRYEKNGTLLEASTFASGLVAPSDPNMLMAPADARLAAASKAVDHGVVLPGIDEDFKGAAPDLGAIELGCEAPTYGPRPEGIDETNEPRCAASSGGDAGVGDAGVDDSGAPSDASGSGGDGASNTDAPSSDSGGCGCRVTRSAASYDSLGALIGLALVVSARRRAPRPRRA